MGLCRCPQRKVSNLFCFKHQVNVCESCLVSEHARCIVRSYVSWLQDKDYSVDCRLCQRSLTETDEETIRLICYDLFHWTCLNEYFRSFPNHTAPDGYTCPTCQTCVFPSANFVSPVADQLRTKFAQANWANRLPILSYNDSIVNHEKLPMLTETEKNGYIIVNPTAPNTNTTTLETTSGLSHLPHRSIEITETSKTTQPSDIDFDDDKYKRRSVFTWFARWLRSRQSSNRKNSNRSNMSSTRFTIYITFIILFVFLTLITVLYHITRGDNNDNLNLADDPQFNPLNNPFIRVAGRFMNSPLRELRLSPENEQSNASAIGPRLIKS